jgi:hypothetical protein
MDTESHFQVYLLLNKESIRLHCGGCGWNPVALKADVSTRYGSKSSSMCVTKQNSHTGSLARPDTFHVTLPVHSRRITWHRLVFPKQENNYSSPKV